MQDQNKVQVQEFTLSTKIRNEVVKYRKWKSKDRKKFIKAMKEPNFSEIDASAVLVYDCIESDRAFSPDEFRYMLTCIRADSVKSTSDFKLVCPECSHKFVSTQELKKLYVQEFKPQDLITVESTTLQFGKIKNREYYLKALSNCITSDDVYFTDFLYSIKELNGSDVFTMDSLVQYFDELDTDELDELFDVYDEQKVTINDIKQCDCPECTHKFKVQFDEIPGFFPDKWFTR